LRVSASISLLEGVERTLLSRGVDIEPVDQSAHGREVFTDYSRQV